MTLNLIRLTASLSMAAFVAVAGANAQAPAPPDAAAPAPPVSGQPAQQAPAVPGGAGTAGAATAGDVAEGPLAERRRALRQKILAAEKEGIGIGAYMQAFHFIEEAVRNGTPSAQIDRRIDSISSGIDDQMRRSAALKTQRAVQGAPAGSPPGQASADPGGAAAGIIGGAGGGTGGVIERLRERYGDQIRQVLEDPDARERLLQSDMAKEALKRLQQR